VSPPAESLWDWARRAYSADGVEALCLRLQDEGGQSVPLLLWAAWARAEPGPTLGEAASLARTWEDEVVGRLRAARRALKGAPGVGAEARERLRAQARVVELAAEQALLEALEALPAGAATGSVEGALAAASAAWGTPAPAALLDALAQATARVARGPVCLG
jgi:uncharacterized protein (TIGR02444 family)